MDDPAAADGADDEYMAMDAEQWSDHEDIYENGDTSEPNPASRGDRKETAVANRPLQNTNNSPATQPALPLPDRYQTIRRPQQSGNRTKQLSQLALLRVTTLCLLVLCLLLIGSLIALSFVYNHLAEAHLEETMKTDQLREENNNLNQQIGNIRNLSQTYFISSTQRPECLTVQNLYILNYEVLEEQLRRNSFYLFSQTVTTRGWNCTSYSP
ncbi:uncharacterized protein LOC125015944 [Mugil cephalus]|uniref:uncharacterized protein LOC125015944 n=1 Tax=Mugil cephalus TaxID=48193 RepID=UPI001FB722AA|nr:uncharacterized protein LOC125015944 [Mugil cephalus]